MVRIKNISPLGDLDVPAMRRVVAAGEVVEVDDADLADNLLEQSTNWAPQPTKGKEE